MGNKLEDFRLTKYEERISLIIALQLYKDKYGDREIKDLLERISRIECQLGGCKYCNDEQAAAEADRFADYDD
jgi:hypothetical protein